MNELELDLADATRTEQLGQALAVLDLAPAVIYLHGELGAGKTTLSRGFIQGRGHHGAVKSPTYTLVEPYELPGGPVFHLDLYRLNDAAELEFLGLDDLLARDGVCLIEWPERAGHDLPPPDLSIRLTHRNESRRAHLIAHNARAQAWLTAIVTHFQSSSQLKD